jgi:hypothetical protein
MSALPHSSQVDRSDTQESLCRRVGDSGRKNAIALWPPAPVGRTNSDTETFVAQRDHEEVSQSCVSTHPLVHNTSPPKTAVVRPASQRIASLLPVTCELKKVTVTPPRNKHIIKIIFQSYGNFSLLLCQSLN